MEKAYAEALGLFGFLKNVPLCNSRQHPKERRRTGHIMFQRSSVITSNHKTANGRP